MFTIILCSYIDAIFVLFNNQYTTVYITYNGNNGWWLKKIYEQ